MRTTGTLSIALALALPAAGRATSLSDEFGVGTSQTTPINPRSGYLYDRITGVFDIADPLSLRLEAIGTHDFATSPQHGAHFQLVGREIFSASAGLDWELSDHVFLYGEGFFSPTSTSSSDAPVPFGPTNQADALINSTSSVYGFLAKVGYDTAGDSDYETMVDGALSLVHYSSRQSVTGVETDSGPVDIQSVIDSCNLTQQGGCDEYVNAATRQGVELNQYRASASVTETIHQTDLSLGGAYYWYDHDPTTLGYFSLATVGRSFATSSGLPSLAPLRYTVRPGLGRSFGAMRVDLWYQYGRYVIHEEQSHGAGLKLQYRFGRAFSAWLRLDAQDDFDRQQNDTTVSALIVIGLKGRF